MPDCLFHRQCKPSQRTFGLVQGCWRLQENQRYKASSYCWQSGQYPSCPYYMRKYKRWQGMSWDDCRDKTQVSVIEGNTRWQGIPGRGCGQNCAGTWTEYRLHQIQRRRSHIRSGAGTLDRGALNLMAWQLPATCPQLWERMCHSHGYDRYCGNIQAVTIHLMFLMVIWSAVYSDSTGMSRQCTNNASIVIYFGNLPEIKVTLVRRFRAYFERFHRLRCPHRALFNFQNLLQNRRPYDPEILRNAL